MKGFNNTAFAFMEREGDLYAQGAWGYVHKSEPPREVIDAVRRVMRGEVVVRR